MSFRSLHLAVERAPARFEFVLTRGTRRFHWLAVKVPTSVSPERRKSKKSNWEYLHVWHTLKRMRYSSIPFGVERPSMAGGAQYVSARLTRLATSNASCEIGSNQRPLCSGFELPSKITDVVHI